MTSTSKSRQTGSTTSSNTISGQTVAGFHLFVAEDPADPRPGALVVFGIDVWLNDFPD